MATSGDQEENERSFNLDEALRSFKDASDDKDLDSETESEGPTEDLTMFCKTCLNPYCGEKKAGTIVLRCEKCGQTDTVLEEKAVDLNPDQWIGNLMMNRFMQVLKEQEDLGLNIADPLFADDEFKRYSLAVSEYTFNMKALSDHLHRLVSHASVLREAMHKVTDEEIAAVEREREKDPEEFERQFEHQKQRFMSSMEQNRILQPKKTDSEMHASGEPDNSIDEGIDSIITGAVRTSEGTISETDTVEPTGKVGSDIEEMNNTEVDTCKASEASISDNDTVEPTVNVCSDLEEMINSDVDTCKTVQTDTEIGMDINSQIESSGREAAMETCDNDIVQDDIDASKTNMELESDIGGKEPDITDKYGCSTLVEEESRITEEKHNESSASERSDQDDAVMDWLPASFRQQLKELPSIVVSLIQTLITKYELPQDIYDNVMERLWNPVSEQPAKDVKDVDAVEDGANATASKDAASESKADLSESTEVDKCEEAEANDNSTEKPSSDTEDTTSEDEEYFFNITKKKLKSEVFEVLYPKFSVKFQSRPEEFVEDRNAKQTCDSQKEKKPVREKQVKGNVECAANDTGNTVTDTNNSTDTKCNEKHESVTASKTVEDKVEDKVNNEETDTKPSRPAFKYDSAPEGVGFHTISTAFISELQQRKHKALVIRKDKALATINEKIVLLKQEVEKVEDTVRDELTQAYANKVKKVEKQRKQLDARHQHIQKVEDLLTYYARTGQTEKLADLMAQLDIQYEN